jgi:hypothetical protein
MCTNAALVCPANRVVSMHLVIRRRAVKPAVL